MIKIAITGPESTGKTTLARQMAKSFNTVYVPEYARDYLNQIDRGYTYEDVLRIAEGQFKKEEEIQGIANQIVFCDTGLLVLRIWLADKFGAIPGWIDKALGEGNYDYFLLMAPDLPWEGDQLREDPERLDELFKAYQEKLNTFQLTYQSIYGKGERRFNNALQVVEEWLTNTPTGY